MKRFAAFTSQFAVVFLLLTLVNINISQANQPFPLGPNLQMTPGSLCTRPSHYRYPERIRYCERNVESETKYMIMHAYDRTYGYSITRMPRQQFKIDHFIPLCMGGSNEVSNLWPQHQSVFQQTDLLEQRLCEKMAQGRLLQARAVEIIKQAKTNLHVVTQIMMQVSGL